jgi:hypothetical protein
VLSRLMRKSVLYCYQVVASIDENSIVVFQSKDQAYNNSSNNNVRVDGQDNCFGTLSFSREICNYEGRYIIKKIEYKITQDAIDNTILNILM